MAESEGLKAFGHAFDRGAITDMGLTCVCLRHSFPGTGTESARSLSRIRFGDLIKEKQFCTATVNSSRWTEEVEAGPPHYEAIRKGSSR